MLALSYSITISAPQDPCQVRLLLAHDGCQYQYCNNTRGGPTRETIPVTVSCNLERSTTACSSYIASPGAAAACRGFYRMLSKPGHGSVMHSQLQHHAHPCTAPLVVSANV